MNNDNQFRYTYSAPTDKERREIEDIRKNYLPQSKEESDFARLRALDNKVCQLPATLALSLGILGTLIFGLGLTMILEWKLIVWGVVISVVGLIPVALAYPAHAALTKKMKQKYGAEILELSEKLLNDK